MKWFKGTDGCGACGAHLTNFSVRSDRRVYVGCVRYDCTLQSTGIISITATRTRQIFSSCCTKVSKRMYVHVQACAHAREIPVPARGWLAAQVSLPAPGPSLQRRARLWRSRLAAPAVRWRQSGGNTPWQAEQSVRLGTSGLSSLSRSTSSGSSSCCVLSLDRTGARPLILLERFFLTSRLCVCTHVHAHTRTHACTCPGSMHTCPRLRVYELNACT